jgi:uncharacterized membrane protein YdjX (TVP38/TMEM64 family)
VSEQVSVKGAGSAHHAQEQHEGLEDRGNTQGRWRPIALIAGIIAILILSKFFGLGQRLGDLREWIAALEPWGPAVFILLYVSATVAALPGSAITVAAGALFGSILGVILVSIASTLGASLSFLIGRYFAREAVARWLEDNEKFNRLDRLTEKHGAIIVALTRLVPLFPFNLLNYGFGLTRVPFGTYVFWSWLCMLPGTVLYVVGADAVVKGIAEGRVPWLLVAALAVAGIILIFLVRRARRILTIKETETKAASAK